MAPLALGLGVSRAQANTTPGSPASCEAPASASGLRLLPDGPAFTPDEWPADTVLSGIDPQPSSNLTSQAIDPTSTTAYTLAASVTVDHDFARLQSFNWATHEMKSGPTFRVNDLTLASGYLWVYGSETLAGQPLGAVLCEVSPSTLRVIRQVRIPAVRQGVGMSVAPGPAGSIWASAARTVVRVDTGDGFVLRTLTIPSGYFESISSDPGARYLYASVAYPDVDGSMVDQQVDEFDAESGRELDATGAKNAVVYSVSGGAVVATPNGVADSFRVGMSGETLLLRQSGLTVITPPGYDAEDASFRSPPGDVFAWMMSGGAFYGGGVLWIANENGVVACVDPASGALRASEHNLQSAGEFGLPVGVETQTHRLLVVSDDQLVAIEPPAACWS